MFVAGIPERLHFFYWFRLKHGQLMYAGVVVNECLVCMLNCVARGCVDIAI